MGRKCGPRHGSMQFWPRQRAVKPLHRVNWAALHDNAKKTSMEGPGLMGFICYKAGMKSAYVKDDTANSITKNKRIVVPCTIVECPTMKIYSVRFYKNNKVMKEVLNDNLDKELKRKLRFPEHASNAKEIIEKMGNENLYEDIRVIVYSQVKKTEIKKTPDVTELGISGAKKEDKLKWIKENLSKEISIFDVIGDKIKLIDFRGITKGKGFQGAVKRFGVTLRPHKSEKGQRRVGSIGPWHPSMVSFRVPMPGQTGYYNRIVYNNLVLSKGKADDKAIASTNENGLKRYGEITADYLVVKGSVQGPKKRQLLITPALRPTKKLAKLKYELIELR